MTRYAAYLIAVGTGSYVWGKTTPCFQSEQVALETVLPAARSKRNDVAHQVVACIYIGSEAGGDFCPVAGYIVKARYFMPVTDFFGNSSQYIPFKDDFGIFVDGSGKGSFSPVFVCLFLLSFFSGIIDDFRYPSYRVILISNLFTARPLNGRNLSGKVAAVVTYESVKASLFDHIPLRYPARRYIPLRSRLPRPGADPPYHTGNEA